MSTARTAPSTPAEVAVGAWLHNPVTGELARVSVSPAETDGRRIEVDLWLQPGAAVARAHVHEHFIERFEVVAGEVGLQVGSRESVARPGDGIVEVPAGAVHDWWNAGDGVAHVRVEVAATRARVSRRDPIHQAARGGPGRSLRAARRGRAQDRPRSPRTGELHGPAAACAIPDPGEDGLAALLARPVRARTAHRRG
jgi:mannose-6-phosphate isomerase-like protein (cupin superfamily)